MIRTGLIGFGMASRVFHAPLIASVEGLELSAVVERNSRHAEAAYPGITTYSSIEGMLADESIELLVIATPNPTHAPLAHQALQVGRHVVVDKPTATNSADILDLIQLTQSKCRLLIPFQNRRWDGDFLTIRKLLNENAFGSVVYFESTFDRWRPTPRLNMWKENGDPGGGNLLDLGTHIVDQALQLFGDPQAVTADISTEREHGVTDDAFTIRLHYSNKLVVLSANCLANLPRPRFTIRGTKANFVKHGLDPQEARLKDHQNGMDHQSGMDAGSEIWGEEPAVAWGTLAASVDDATGTNPNDFSLERIETIPGDYRIFYAGVRDAILGKSAPPVLAQDAWKTARILECARESSESGQRITSLFL